jgi:glucose-6-phosphate isomerase
MVKVDISGAQGFFKEIPDYASAATAHRKLEEMKSTGTGFAGWLDLPERIAVQELKSIISTSDKIKKQSEALVVIGIGGSYLGARAAIDLLCSPDHNRLGNGPEVYFLGNSLSADALNDALSILGEKDFSINVISKSGSTLESALAFRIFKGCWKKNMEKPEQGRALWPQPMLLRVF